MHRSGTSLTARLLGDLGWYLGREDELLGPREDNPDGFFERADVQVLNDRILSQLGASWDGPPELAELDTDDATWADELSSLVTTIQADAGDSPFALKDPRLCVLWPLWERQLASAARLVLVFRHPAEVAASLQKRDGMPLVAGLALWELYVRRSLAAAKDRHVVVLRYGDLVEKPDETVRRLAQALGTTVPEDHTPAVRPELHRNRHVADEVPLTSSQSALWSWIVQAPMSMDQIDPDDIPVRQCELSIELIRSRRQAAVLRADVALLRRSLEDSEAKRARQAEQRAASEQALRDERDANAQDLRTATTELAVLRDRVRHHESVQARQEEQIERDSTRLNELLEERALLDHHVEDLRVRRLEQAERIETLCRESQETEVLLAAARVERDSAVRIAESRERVFQFERERLIRAVSSVESQRRIEEAAVAAMRGSRTWRWGRRLAGPLASRSTGKGEA